LATLSWFHKDKKLSEEVRVSVVADSTTGALGFEFPYFTNGAGIPEKLRIELPESELVILLSQVAAEVARRSMVGG
jgi:hypothetical protein